MIIRNGIPIAQCFANAIIAPKDNEIQKNTNATTKIVAINPPPNSATKPANHTKNISISNLRFNVPR